MRLILRIRSLPQNSDFFTVNGRKERGNEEPKEYPFPVQRGGKSFSKDFFKMRNLIQEEQYVNDHFKGNQ